MSPTHIKIRDVAGVLNYTDWVIKGIHCYIQNTVLVNSSSSHLRGVASCCQ